MTESPIVNEWIAQASEDARLSTFREALLAVLEERFPNAIPADIVETIKAQPSAAMLTQWIRRATSASTIDDFRAYLRQ